MPRGTHLTIEQKTIITTLNSTHHSNRAIAKAINRSPKVVSSYLRDPANYGKKNRTGRPSKMTQRDKRRICAEVKRTGMGAKRIQKTLSISVSPRTIRRFLANESGFQYTKMKQSPILSHEHKQKRVEWALEHVTWGPTQWRKVVFSDEKKFNLDGPDGFAYYWKHDEGQEKIFSKRQGGGKSVMIWSCFSYFGLCDLVILKGKQDSKKYCEVLEHNLLPFTSLVHGENWIFQQDNASIHVSKYSREWIEAHNVLLLSWPARSPDLNPIENLWAILARIVYKDSRQYADVPSLIFAIKAAWGQIGEETLHKLVGSMQKRCADVIRLHGAKTKY